jgi:hypothetical protein
LDSGRPPAQIKGLIKFAIPRRKNHGCVTATFNIRVTPANSTTSRHMPALWELPRTEPYTLLVPCTVVGTNWAKQHPWGSAIYKAEIASQREQRTHHQEYVIVCNLSISFSALVLHASRQALSFFFRKMYPLAHQEMVHTCGGVIRILFIRCQRPAGKEDIHHHGTSFEENYLDSVSDYQLYQPSCYNCRKVGLFVV